MITTTSPQTFSSRIKRGLLLLFILTGLSAGILSAPADQPDADHRALFDGRTLDGWEGDLNYWRVEDSVIVGEIPKGQMLRKNTWLVWRGGELVDFDLRLQVRLTGAPRANSGIQIRCQVKDVDHVSGYQADLDQGKTWLGRIYDEHGRGLLVERGSRVSIDPDGHRQVRTLAPAAEYEVLFRENGWNDYRIVGVGDRITVFVNGTLFSDLVDQQTDQTDHRGLLALQLHAGPHTRVEFRDISLQPPPPNDPVPGEFSIRESATDDVDAGERSIRNPLLQHLTAAPVKPDASGTGTETTAQMFVPDGFSVDVIAAEPDVHQPMAFTFDAKGRLWVVEGHCYPQRRPEGEGLDRVLIFSDDDSNGSFESREVFIEGLNLVSGLEIGYGGVWIGAAPELLFIPDADGDDVPDSEPRVLLDGFGYADTHETLNSFIWGPDGWLYGNQGVFNTSLIGRPGTPDSERILLKPGVWRYHPTRHVFEVFAHGGSNQWGLDYDDFGQWFMTHCRSRWGRGATTHVIHGAHYWNQRNTGYAPFISSQNPPHMPAMRNYMLASARYGHGEGGAGKKGSRAVYGGHAHVGTMIYLGNNWPDKYRNHLFTHNLHGHQMNQLVNRREAGGFNTLHAGQDVFFCADKQYIGVDLKYGPDGAVYFSDWYDPRHCHNPNVELWDRGNGRMYRMKYDATYDPVSVDLTQASDEQLVKAQLHDNDWFARTARRLLSERSGTRKISAAALQQLRDFALAHSDPARRLRAVWAAHAAGEFNVELAAQLLQDENEYVRGWTIQLAVEAFDSGKLAHLSGSLPQDESSLFVRRCLASAIQRVPDNMGWALAEWLGSQPENAVDRDLPLLLWYGLAKLMPEDVDRALALADTTQIPALRDYIEWYAARLSQRGREYLSGRLADASGVDELRLVSLLDLAVRGMQNQPQPDNWAEISPRLYESPDGRVQRAAASLGAVFGDVSLFQRMRKVLTEPESDVETLKHAATLLAGDASQENLRVLLPLLDTVELVVPVLPLLTRYQDARVADELIRRISDWDAKLQSTAMEVLCSRAEWADRVLDGIAARNLSRGLLTPWHVRQLLSLEDEQINGRLAREWGAVNQTSAERRAEIAGVIKEFKEAPLWAFNREKGAEHFKKLCASCHLPNEGNERLGPNLDGTGAKGIEYIVENIVDPNAVIGRDYQAWIVVTNGGRVITGLIESQTDSAVTIRIATSTVTIGRDEIDEMQISDNSFMPQGLLKELNDRERMELLIHLRLMR